MHATSPSVTDCADVLRSQPAAGGRRFVYIGEHFTVDEALDHCERKRLGSPRLERGPDGKIRGIAEELTE